MILRVSIDARDPAHVARVLAEMLDCRAVPSASGWVLPMGESALEITARLDPTPIAGGCRLALATPLTIAQVFALAGREGWPARYRRTPGAIELHVEGDRLIEVLTAEMQVDHRERTRLAE